MTPHLDAARLRAWLEGDLPDDARRALLAHLDAGCPDCEGLIDREVDGDTLARLLDAEEAPAAAPPAWRDATPPERPTLRVVAPIPTSLRAPSPAEPTRSRRWLLVGSTVAFAAAAVLAVAVVPPRGPATPQSAYRQKGPVAGAPVVTLQVALARDDGGRLAPERLVRPGERLPADATLLFETAADRPAARYLFAVDGQDATHLLAPPAGATPPVEPAGAQPTRWEGGYVALDLADLAGPVRIVAAASAEARPAGDAVAAWGRRDPAFGFAELVVEVAR